MSGSGGRARRIAVVALLLTSVACSSDGGSGDADAADDPTTSTTSVALPVGEVHFTQRACDAVATEPDRVTCGVLEVPERHEDGGSPTIEVAVAIVEPAGPGGAAEPVVFLAGGPGYGSAGGVEYMLTDGPVDRTIVLLDYRGVGRSQPSLACTENDDLGLPALGRPGDDPEVRAQDVAALRACRERLVGDGIDIAAYNYEEIAADLEALRLALGYEQWDLWGLSNGGRVALEVARRYPDGVRALVLDAPSPPQGNLLGNLWVHGEEAFVRLFDACAADPACGEAFPDLDATFQQLVTELGESPVEVSVAPAAGEPPIPVLFTDTLALNALRQALYETPLVPLLPFYINELANGRNLSVVAQLIIERTPSEGFSDGMANTVSCRDEVAFLPDDFFAEQAEDLPLSAPVVRNIDLAQTCEIWDVGQAPDVIDELVRSDIPALVLTGQFDPVHPLSDAQSIAEGLPNATVVELPGLGHGTIGNHDCADEMMAAFLDAPTEPVDTSCAAAMPAPQWLTG